MLFKIRVIKKHFYFLFDLVLLHWALCKLYLCLCGYTVKEWRGTLIISAYNQFILILFFHYTTKFVYIISSKFHTDVQNFLIGTLHMLPNKLF